MRQKGLQKCAISGRPGISQQNLEPVLQLMWQCLSNCLSRCTCKSHARPTMTPMTG